MAIFKRGTLNQLWNDLCSPTPNRHNKAMQEWIQWAGRDESSHQEVIRILTEGLEYSQDPWVPARAARIIESIVAPSKSREVWNRLLHDPRTDVATHAAMTITDS